MHAEAASQKMVVPQYHELRGSFPAGGNLALVIPVGREYPLSCNELFFLQGTDALRLSCDSCCPIKSSCLLSHFAGLTGRGLGFLDISYPRDRLLCPNNPAVLEI